MIRVLDFYETRKNKNQNTSQGRGEGSSPVAGGTAKQPATVEQTQDMEITDFEGEVNETILAPKSTRGYPIRKIGTPITMGINLDSKIQQIDQDLRRYDNTDSIILGDDFISNKVRIYEPFTEEFPKTPPISLTPTISRASMSSHFSGHAPTGYFKLEQSRWVR